MTHACKFALLQSSCAQEAAGYIEYLRLPPAGGLRMNGGTYVALYAAALLLFPHILIACSALTALTISYATGL